MNVQVAVLSVTFSDAERVVFMFFAAAELQEWFHFFQTPVRVLSVELVVGPVKVLARRQPRVRERLILNHGGLQREEKHPPAPVTGGQQRITRCG